MSGGLGPLSPPRAARLAGRAARAVELPDVCVSRVHVVVACCAHLAHTTVAW